MIALYSVRQDGSWSVAFADPAYEDHANDDAEIYWLCECKNPAFEDDPYFTRDNPQHRFAAVGETGEVSLLSQRLALYGTDRKNPHPRTWHWWNPKRFKSFDAAKRFAILYAKRHKLTLDDVR